MDDVGLKARLARRESWAYLAGVFIGVFSVCAEAGLAIAGQDSLFKDSSEFTATAIGLVTAFLGTGATAQIKRGRQRGEEAARAVQAAAAPVVPALGGTTSNTMPPSKTPAPVTDAPPAADGDYDNARLNDVAQQ